MKGFNFGNHYCNASLELIGLTVDSDEDDIRAAAKREMHDLRDNYGDEILDDITTQDLVEYLEVWVEDERRKRDETAAEEFEARLECVAIHAWERWTKNGLRLDEEDRIQTLKSTRDAAANSYLDGMDDLAWYKATLERLGCAQTEEIDQ